MSSKVLVGREALAARGVLFVFVLALGTLLAGCGGTEDEADLDVPASPEEAGSLVVRVSGTEGVPYSGNYGSLAGALEIAEGTVGAEPTDYEVGVEEGVSDGVIASFQKTESGQGELKVQTLADDKVVVESRTLAEFGAANADWLPQMSLPEGTPPEDEMIFEDEIVSPEEEGPPPKDEEVTSEG
jgi:hypothetical protein